MTNKYLANLINAAPYVDKCVAYHGFASRSHMVRLCYDALDRIMKDGGRIKWPPEFVMSLDPERKESK